MTFNYILISKLKEIIQNKRMAVIIVICLVLGYSFILIFSSKLSEINRRMEFAQLKRIENTWISTEFNQKRIFKDPEIIAGTVHRTNYKKTVVYFTFNGKTHRTHAVEMNKELPYHYRIEGFSDAMFDDRSEKRIMISQDLANEFNIQVGDKLSVNGSPWMVDAIFICEYFRRRILFPENVGVGHNDGYYSDHAIVRFSEEVLKSHPELLELLNGKKFTSLQQFQHYTIESLKSHAMYLIGFAAIFITLSILNCYLVFYANISYKRKIYGIKETYGASSLTCFGDIFLENGIFSLLAYHIACFLVHIFRHNIPVFFYTEVTFLVYSVGLVIVFIITILYSLLIFLKINKYATIKLLKE